MLRDVGEGPISRTLSILVVIAYGAAAFNKKDQLWAAMSIGYCVFALCCVWFPGTIGIPPRQTLPIGRTGKETPARLVWLIGWALLLLPMIITLLVWLQLPAPLRRQL